MRRKELMKMVLISTSLTIALVGCGAPTDTDTTTTIQDTAAAIESANSNVDISRDNATTTLVIDEFSDKDLDDTYDLNTAIQIDLSNESGDVEITKEGTYVLSGNLNGQVIIDSDGSDIKLVLANVSINCENSAGIYVKKADKVIITLPEGTNNTISDGVEYVYDDATKEEPNAAIYSKADLTFNGIGSLVVNGNFNNGIRSNDTLKFVNGNITIKAVANAITGKDGVIIADGTYTIDAGNHGIKSTNDSDTTLGYIAIYGGSFDITAVEDGLHGVNDVIIYGGDIRISVNDDGIHSDTNLIIEGGSVDVLSSYEGLEGANVYINGGDINVKASDDGINSAGGTDSLENVMPNRDSFREGSDTHVYINGGNVYVDASGDGIDSNGYIFVNGGSVIVNGPVDNMNAAVDYQSGLEITGGTLLAVGSAGMAGAPTATSNQSFIMTNTNGVEGSIITIYDSNNNEIYNYTAIKTFSTVIFASADIVEEQLYYVSIDGGERLEVTAGDFTQAGFGGGHGNGGFNQFDREEDFGQRGNMGEKPTGDFQGGERPTGEMPTGEMPTGETPPQMPN